MMKILISGCGGAPSEGVVRSLLRSGKNEEIIGMGSGPSDLILSNAIRKYIVPYTNEISYNDSLKKIFKAESPNLVHFQNDLEVFEASKLREEITAAGPDALLWLRGMDAKPMLTTKEQMQEQLIQL